MVQNYYPYGRDMGDTTLNYSIAPNNRYRYEGKEWNATLGMDLYDFGARYYDPILATWHSIDPLAEQNPDWSPYNYVNGNPVNIMDPDGMQPSSGITHYDLPEATVKSGGGGSALGSLSIYGTIISAGLSVVDNINKFTPGFSSVQDFSGIHAGQGNAMSTQGPGVPYSSSINAGIEPNVVTIPKSGGYIYVYRTWESNRSTISAFKTDDSRISGYILEPAGPSTTTPNQDKRIPAGTYKLKTHVNARLHSQYQLYNDQVPLSRYILIHIGNGPDDTEGCLLPGLTMHPDNVGPSLPILNKLNNYIRSLNGNVRVIIYDPVKR